MQTISRRTMLISAAAGLAMGRAAVAQQPFRPRFGDQVVLPPQLPPSLPPLLEISDDDDAVLDALTYMLWRAPSMEELVSITPFTVMNRNYKAGYFDLPPFGFQPGPNTSGLGAFNDRLAVLFACDVVAQGGSGFDGAINAVVLQQKLKVTTNSDEAVRYSKETYDALLLESRAPNNAGAQPLSRYRFGTESVWGTLLAHEAAGDGFIASMLQIYASPGREAEAMQRLKLTLYKVRLLNPAAADIVVQRWSEDKILSIAVREPWPDNYYDKLTTRKNPRPMGMLVSSAMNVQVDRGKRVCTALVGPNGQPFTKCSHSSNPVFGEPVWRLLARKAAPLGVLGSPKWPQGAQL